MAKNIQDLRALLFDTIEGIQKGTIDVEKARAITEISQVIVNTAKTEVDFLKNVNGQGNTGFIGSNAKQLKS